jgi:hypothetical protein
VTLAALAIHVEAWLQEELGAQRSLLDVLARIEAAARAGSSAELERSGRELATLLSGAGARDARRGALLAKLAAALELAAGGVTLSRLFARLAEERIETARLESMRAELFDVARSVVGTGRRVAAVAQYHRGLLEELCRLFLVGAPDAGGQLVDARG